MIYFVRQGGQYIKIGYATDVPQRLSQLQIGNPHDLFLYCALMGGEQEERKIHGYLKQHRIRGEWFRWNSDIQYFIQQLMEYNDIDYAIKIDKYADARIEREINNTNHLKLISSA